MANRIFRGRVINSIRHALNEAVTASDVNHPGLVGRYRELLAANVLRPMLPLDYSIGTGKIADSTDRLTSEIDLVIFQRNAIPPILWSDRDGVFPVESCLYAVEVKSRLTSAEVQDSIRKAGEALLLRERHRHTGYEFQDTDLVFALFAFDSDTKDLSKELERYCRLDPAGMVNPAVNVICVAGIGYLFFDSLAKEWRGLPASQDHDEVIEFVAGVSNTVLAVSNIRTQGLALGAYLMDDEASGVKEQGNARSGPVAASPMPPSSRAPRVGRNDPCPCGTGKKYKKCHGA